jgi:hypothetical protein
MNQQDTLSMSKQYLVVDFECIQPNQWQSVAIVLYEPATGTILREFQTACDRSCTSMTPSTRDFWMRNADAFQYNIQQGMGRTAKDEEASIGRFVTRLKADYPNFYLISDAPEYDIGLINNILRRQGCPSMSHRSEKIYFQSICTWSSKKTLDLLGIPIHHRDHVGLDTLVAKGLLAHTPVFDCMRILNEYLCILATIELSSVK